MGSPEVFVDPAELRDVGRGLQGGLRLVDAALSRDGGRLAASGTAAQWPSGPLLAETAAGWQAYLKNLNRRVDEFGTGLVASADGFEASDDYSAAELAGIPKGHPAYGRAQGY